eukprot:6104119-Amphidinium_carterae.1
MAAHLFPWWQLRSKTCTTTAAPRVPQNKRQKDRSHQKHQGNKHFVNFLSHFCSCGFGAWGSGGGTIFGP